MEINKEITCPFLLRVFYKFNRHNSIHVYQQCLKYSTNNYKNDSFYNYPNQQLQLYTWYDISLRQLYDIIIKNIDIRNNTMQDVTLSLCLVCLDRNGNYTIKHVSFFMINSLLILKCI